jgi:hypothetical protein
MADRIDTLVMVVEGWIRRIVRSWMHAGGANVRWSRDAGGSVSSSLEPTVLSGQLASYEMHVIRTQDLFILS